MLSLQWQARNKFKAGLNFVPVSSIESKVLIVPEFGSVEDGRFLLDCRFDPGYKTVIEEEYWEEAHLVDPYFSGTEYDSDDELDLDELGGSEMF
jgi:hypothetical protein